MADPNDLIAQAATGASNQTVGGTVANIVAGNANTNTETVNAVNTAANGGPDWNAYLKANPDVAAEYGKVNGPGLKFYLGLGGGPHDPGMTAEEFAQYHYNTAGKAEGRTLPTVAGLTDTAKTTTDNAIDTAKNGADDAYKQIGTAVSQFLTGGQTFVTNLVNQNTTDNKNTVDTVTKLVNGVTTNNDKLTQSITDAQANVGSQLAAAVAAFNKAQTQQAHSADLGAILTANRKKMAAASATSSTGPGGVEGSAMTLGGNTLLGT